VSPLSEEESVEESGEESEGGSSEEGSQVTGGVQFDSPPNPYQFLKSRLGMGASALAPAPASEAMATQFLVATMSAERLAREALATAERGAQSNLAASERAHALNLQSADGNKAAEREQASQRFQIAVAGAQQQAAREHQLFLLTLQGESAKQLAAAAAATAATRETSQTSVAAIAAAATATREYSQGFNEEDSSAEAV
jgi:hypothetical protein